VVRVALTVASVVGSEKEPGSPIGARSVEMQLKKFGRQLHG
jgi:hypothetical protein